MPTSKKRFGQHFLHDKNIIQRILDVFHPLSTQHIVEIGPGQGALTAPLLTLLKKLEVIEIDSDLIPALDTRCKNYGTLTIYHQDVLQFNFDDIIKTLPLRIIGNLPYNISTPLLFHLLKFSPHIADMHVMLQREVGERIVAKPKDKMYGRLSVMVQYHCEAALLFPVPASAFYPPPQVESCFIRLIPHQNLPYPALHYSQFKTVVNEAFSHRRKTLRNSLKKFFSDEDWKKIGSIDSHLRPEEMSVANFVFLSNYLNRG